MKLMQLINVIVATADIWAGIRILLCLIGICILGFLCYLWMVYSIRRKYIKNPIGWRIKYWIDHEDYYGIVIKKVNSFDDTETWVYVIYDNMQLEINIEDTMPISKER